MSEFRDINGHTPSLVPSLAAVKPMDVATDAASSPAREILLKVGLMRRSLACRTVSDLEVTSPSAISVLPSPGTTDALMTPLLVCLAALVPLLAYAYSDSPPVVAWASHQYVSSFER